MDRSKFNDKREWRKFAVGLGIILAVIASLLLIKARPAYPWFYGAAALVVLTGVLLPLLIKPLFILFSYLGFGLGWLMTRLILTALFFLIITPIGFICRLFGKRFLDLRFDRRPETYWIEKAQDRDREGVSGYENQF
jgi:hypothetical protein